MANDIGRRIFIFFNTSNHVRNVDDDLLSLNLNLCGARLFVNPLGPQFLNIFKRCIKIELRLGTGRLSGNIAIIPVEASGRLFL
jgi:hypothetical protein